VSADPRPGLLIRPAEAADLDRLAGLEMAGFTGDRLGRRSLARLLRRASALALVAVADGRVVGYAMVLFREGSRVARLYSLVRDPEMAGRGVGAALLAAAERAAAARGRLEMRLEVREDNDAARALYEHRGYRPLGRRAGYYEDGADALRMRKPLIGTAR
jgi:ribosomal protein S18 acetylase RimI-like enzyme